MITAAAGMLQMYCFPHISKGSAIAVFQQKELLAPELYSISFVLQNKK